MAKIKRGKTYEKGTESSKLYKNFGKDWTSGELFAALQFVHAGLPIKGSNGYTTLLQRNKAGFSAIIDKLSIRYREWDDIKVGKQVVGYDDSKQRKDPLDRLKHEPWRQSEPWVASDYYFLGRAHSAQGLKYGAGEIEYLVKLLGREAEQIESKLDKLTGGGFIKDTPETRALIMQNRLRTYVVYVTSKIQVFEKG